jgi:hypothetical protein
MSEKIRIPAKNSNDCLLREILQSGVNSQLRNTRTWCVFLTGAIIQACLATSDVLGFRNTQTQSTALRRSAANRVFVRCISQENRPTAAYIARPSTKALLNAVRAIWLTRS